MSYANNKGADQPAYPRSDQCLLVRCLDSIISLDSIAEISRLQLASVAAQAGLCLAWSETPEDTFSCCGSVESYHSIQNLNSILSHDTIKRVFRSFRPGQTQIGLCELKELL